MHIPLRIVVLLSVCITTAVAHADEVYLANGDRISGTVLSKAGDTLVIRTDYAGDVSIAWQQVVSLVTSTPVVVQLNDDSRLKGAIVRSDEGAVGIIGIDVIEAGSVPLSRIAMINPPPPPKEKVRLKGHANLGINIAKGNTDKEAYLGDIEVVARTRENRFSAGAVYNQAFDDGVESENNATAYSKYDHFFTEKWFSYVNAVLFRDDFADLNLRSSFGVGTGYQFYETDLTNLSLEGGLSYVNEDFEVAEDDSYPAARWAINFDHFILPKKLQLFHVQEGLLGLQDTSDIIIRTRTGLRAMLVDNFNMTAGFDFDWDNSPAPGNDRIDERYLLSVGYGW